MSCRLSSCRMVSLVGFENVNLVVVGCSLSKVWYGGKGCTLHGLSMFLLESAKDGLLRVDPQDNICRHVSSMEQFAN
jgi:hypothetical protein